MLSDSVGTFAEKWNNQDFRLLENPTGGIKFTLSSKYMIPYKIKNIEEHPKREHLTHLKLFKAFKKIPLAINHS